MKIKKSYCWIHNANHNECNTMGIYQHKKKLFEPWWGRVHEIKSPFISKWCPFLHSQSGSAWEFQGTTSEMKIQSCMHILLGSACIQTLWVGSREHICMNHKGQMFFQNTASMIKKENFHC